MDNQLSYEKYDHVIKNMVQLCRMKIEQKKLDPKDNTVLCMMLFHFMTDTFEVKDMKGERSLVHLPMKYDFEDFRAKEDFTKYFVTKLIVQNSGQCHSMPLLYLILAEEIGAKAHWSISNDHSFVKFKDNRGRWHNIELTSGVLLSDYHYLNSGFIKSEAIRNKVYLEPLSEKETIAEMIGELAASYARKYGYDQFVRNTVEFAMQYYPNSVRLNIVKSNYYTDNAMYVIRQLGVPSLERLPEYPQAYSLYLKMHESYQYLDQLGYEPVPEPIYQDWLQAIEREKLKPEYQKQTNFYQIVK